MKITRNQLAEIIKEEVDKIHKKTVLEENRAKIENAIKRLDEGKTLSEAEMEELWAGLKGVGQMIKKKAGDAAQGLQQKMQAAGQQAKEKVQAAGQQIKQSYQTAEKEAAIKKAQEQMAAIAQKLKNFDKQVAAQKQQLQQQYMQLSGGKPYGGKAIHKPAIAEE